LTPALVNYYLGTIVVYYIIVLIFHKVIYLKYRVPTETEKRIAKKEAELGRPLTDNQKAYIHRWVVVEEGRKAKKRHDTMNNPPKSSPAKGPRTSTSQADLMTSPAARATSSSGSVKTRPQSVAGGTPIKMSGGVATKQEGKEVQAGPVGPRTPGAKGVGLKDLRWRVDVTISTSSMERVLKPAILMEMTLTDGRILTFLVPATRLHELRYNVARVLKEMQSLQLKN